MTDSCDNCHLLNVQAMGVVSKVYPLYLGEYKQNGSFNGHPLYVMHQIFENWRNVTSYLYFRKEGEKTFPGILKKLYYSYLWAKCQF